MAWVVDTSVLLDVHLGDPVFGLPSARCLARYLEDGLILCPVSYIELAPAFGGNNDLQQAFLREAGVSCLEPWIWQDTVEAHRLWTIHIAKRRTGSQLRRPLADVFIEAFARRFQGLITRNPKDFTKVRVITPSLQDA